MVVRRTSDKFREIVLGFLNVSGLSQLVRESQGKPLTRVGGERVQFEFAYDANRAGFVFSLEDSALGVAEKLSEAIGAYAHKHPATVNAFAISDVVYSGSGTSESVKGERMENWNFYLALYRIKD